MGPGTFQMLLRKLNRLSPVSWVPPERLIITRGKNAAFAAPILGVGGGNLQIGGGDGGHMQRIKRGPR